MRNFTPAKKQSDPPIFSKESLWRVLRRSPFSGLRILGNYSRMDRNQSPKFLRLVTEIGRVIRVQFGACTAEVNAGVMERQTKSDTNTGADSKVGQLVIVDAQGTDSSARRKVAACGPLTREVTLVIAAVTFVAIAAGVTYGVLYMSTHQRHADFETVDALSHQTNGLQTTADSPTKSTTVPSSLGSARRRWTPFPRELWGSRRPEAGTPLLSHPLALVIVAHTAGRSCETPQACRNKVRDLQGYSVAHLSKPDVPYNFLIGHDGGAYEGVGWDREGSFSHKYNNCSISIAYIGNYIYLQPTPHQLQATKNILELGVQLQKLTPDYVLVAHNLTANTLSPGNSIYEQIKTLPHFTDDRSYLPF